MRHSPKGDFMGFHLSTIQAVSLLVPVLTAVIGGGLYLYDWYKEPNLTDGKWFESAWIEYGNNENVLSIVHIPDGTGHKTFLAMHEAVNRVDEKSWNPAIDTKPLRLKIFLLDDTNYTYMGSVLVCGKLMHKMCEEPHEARIRDMANLLAYTEIPKFANENYNVMLPNGSVVHMSLSSHYDFWTDSNQVLSVYSNETLQREIDKL